MQQILLNILAPILLMIGLGALLRWKFRIDLSTLTKLNIYLFVPAFVFDKVSQSHLSWASMGGIVVITILQSLTLALIVLAIGRALRIGRTTLAAIMLAVMFYNSGNYGLPLAVLAYPSRAVGDVQSFVILTQNILTFSVGLTIAAMAHHGDFWKGIVVFLRLPVLPMLVASLLARAYLNADPAHHLPGFITTTTGYLSDGLVPVALVTLGAQLAANPRWPRWKPVSLVLVLRLGFGPVQMAGMLYILHICAGKWGGGFTPMDLWPWPAELLVLTASVPTAVNTLLLTLELGGDADLAADCVFWTTICSCFSIPAWIALMRMMFSG